MTFSALSLTSSYAPRIRVALDDLLTAKLIRSWTFQDRKGYVVVASNGVVNEWTTAQAIEWLDSAGYDVTAS